MGLIDGSLIMAQNTTQSEDGNAVVRCIIILTSLGGHSGLNAICGTGFGFLTELTNKGISTNLQFCPESLEVIVEFFT